jgi:ankyrin repeat protein
MQVVALPFRSSLERYQDQAEKLLEAFRSGDPGAIRCFRERHPRFLDPKIPWLPRPLSDSEIQSSALELGDAQLAVARWYDFRNWAALAEYVETVTQDGSPVCRFESGVEAVINGDLAALWSLLGEDPALVRARSTRVTHFDPPVHRATLLHYVAANGVEGYRQKTPPNAVGVAKTLLSAGAEVDSLADIYGGQCTTMALLVSSSPPAKAGVQIELINTLIDLGAAVEGRGTGRWVSPLMTALAFGFRDAAEALALRGARVDNVAAAAGLDRLAETRQLLATADPESRHRALALAALHGHADVVRLLLDAGEDPDRYNPEGNHTHSTPLHQAALAGHAAVVRLLVERRARLDIKDTIYQGTPLDWAIHEGQKEIESYLRAQGARTGQNLEGNAAMIRVILPPHLRTLAAVGAEVELDVPGPVTLRSVLDSLEARYPMLRGTIRDHVSGKRRPMLRFYACEEDMSLESPDFALPGPVASGAEPFWIVAAIAGG